MLPNKPAIAIWYRNPLVKDGGVFTSVNINLTPYLLYTARQDEFAGIAVIIGDQALSTMSGSLLKAHDLREPFPHRHTERFSLTINLYAEQWTTDELLFALFWAGVRYCGWVAQFLYPDYPPEPGKRNFNRHQAASFMWSTSR
jgi:hypothetical protein